jgi:serine/threonine protein phosphatase PrpC
MTDAIRFHAATDVGRVREHNEDNFLVDKKMGLFVVADGMGGHAAGEVASAMAVRAFHDEVKKDAELLTDFVDDARGARRVTQKEVAAMLEAAVSTASTRIYEEAARDQAKRGMGTTLSGLLVLGKKVFVTHCGDSRVYLLRGGSAQQVTEDHTVANELVKRGKMTREQVEKLPQRNAIVRAVGVYERIEADTLVLDLLPGDVYLVCSDGLSGYLEGPEELLPYATKPGDEAVKALIALANSRGGKDNITVVMIRAEGDEATAATEAKHFALKREVLANMPMFQKLSNAEVLRVLQTVEVRTYRDGEDVIREGEKGEELFAVLSGDVRVGRGGAHLATLGVGEHFGEMALIRAQPRSATVTALGPAECLVVKRSDFFDLLRRDHAIGVKILWQFLGVLADRLDSTSGQLRTAREELVAEEIGEFELDLGDETIKTERSPFSTR